MHIHIHIHIYWRRSPNCPASYATARVGCWPRERRPRDRPTWCFIYIYQYINIYVYRHICIHRYIPIYTYILAAVPELPVILRYGSCGLLTNRKSTTRQTNMVLYLFIYIFICMSSRTKTWRQSPSCPWSFATAPATRRRPRDRPIWWYIYISIYQYICI